MSMKKEKERAINFYMECFEVVPWCALDDSDKIYFYKEADIFETDKQLEDYISAMKEKGESL